MLDSFDWIRRSETGAELIATLEFLETVPDLLTDDLEPGPPFSALGGPCRRCWVHAPITTAAEDPVPIPYCRPCQAIRIRAAKLGRVSRGAVIVWGHVNRLPRRLLNKQGFYKNQTLASYAIDEQHFILMMRRKQLKDWFQEISLYDGLSLRGLFQIFPTTAQSRRGNMGELLCRAHYHEARFGMDQLRVRFFSRPYQITFAHAREQQGILTFEATEFAGRLEMATVFRTVLRFEEQEMLQKLLEMEDPAERQFYWGRFMGYLNQQAKDMLTAWDIRHWSPEQVTLLYELVDYVAFYQTD